MANIEKQRAKADAFRRMHREPKVLVLPNVWDVAGARIFEEEGFRAIATTSAGIAFTLGYADGQRIPRDEMFAAVERIAGAVQVPVTADVESGYGNRPEDAAQTARAVMEAGAVGMNLEDAAHDERQTLLELPLQLEKIAAVRETVRKSGIPVVLNARTDVYLRGMGTPESRFDAALQRLMAYRDAGADCLFVPGLRDTETIRRLTSQLKHPVNILATPEFPSIAELEGAGVARVSLGSGPMRATLGLLRRMAREIKTEGTYRTMQGGPSHAEVNRMFL